MAIVITSEYKNKLEELFGYILESKDFSKVDEISSILSECFDTNIKTVIIENNTKDSFFVMSIVPDEFVVDKIATLIMNGSNKDDFVSELWKNCDNWTLEIDSNIFDDKIVNLTAEELTALVLHEIGHVVNTNAIPTKINKVLKYKIATSPITTKAIMSNNKFIKFLYLPIISGCTFNKNRASLKNELRADNFVVKMGYGNQLISAVDKISKINNYDDNSITNEISDSYDFSTNTISDLQSRRTQLNRMKFKRLINRLPNGTKLKYNLNALESSLYDVAADSMLSVNKKINMTCESVNKAIEDYVCEAFGFRNKKLKEITRTELDYIDVQILDMKNNDDRMLILSYINSKLDLCDYYITILKDKKLSKKYQVPQSLSSLLSIRKRLLDSKKRAFQQKIPERIEDIHVFYPVNYQG